MTNPLQTIPNLPVAVGVTGTDQLWINQSGTDRRTSLSVLQSSVPGPPGTQGNPGGNASAIGVATVVSGLSLNTGTASTYNLFHTDGYYTAGDGGGAFYYRNTGSAQPGDLISADGVRLSLSLAQQLTWEMLGAPTTGAIFTGSISGTTLTVTNVQNGTIASSMTLVQAGGGTTVLANTRIVSGSGSSWQVNNSHSATGSIVMVANDSWPYVSAALKLGNHGLLLVGAHYFSQCIAASGFPVNWFGPSNYGVGGGANGPATLYFPTGYSGVVCVPTNLTVNAQGDVTLAGNAPFGGIENSIFERLSIQIGDGSLHTTTVNMRPAVAIYSAVKWVDCKISGADGDGIFIFGNGPTCIADKVAIRDCLISNSYANGIETSGGDANTCDITNNIIAMCRASCIYEHGFLGSGYRVNQVQDNAQNTTAYRSVARVSNILYYSRTDTNLNNPPASSPTQWGVTGSNVGADDWDNTITYHVAAGYRTSGGNNHSEFVSCYSEGAFAPSLFQAQGAGQWLTQVYGGLYGGGIDTTVGGYEGQVGGQYSSYAFSALAGGYVATTTVSGRFDGVTINNAAASGGGNTASILLQNGGAQSVALKAERGASAGGTAVLAAFNGSGTMTDIVYADGASLGFGPISNNSTLNASGTNAWKNIYSFGITLGITGAPIITTGTGSPNTVLSAPIGSLYTDSAGGAGTTLYVKESGTGNTGWVAK